MGRAKVSMFQGFEGFRVWSIGCLNGIRAVIETQNCETLKSANLETLKPFETLKLHPQWPS
jgi:hypothetical protein